jgi:ferritin-like metal-binding protein YciE
MSVHSITNLEDLLIHELQDLLSAERQLVGSLPPVNDAATDAALRRTITEHLAETQAHAERLENALAALDAPVRSVLCEAMQGLITELKRAMTLIEAGDVRDAAIIARLQRIEHYEIAGYGCARAFAEEVGRGDVVDLLTATLEEERSADRGLTLIAESRVNPAAAPTDAG